MGIKDLWTILGPFCERKPLYELQGKTVAIDLSCWICEAQNIAEYHIQPRMYLRTCFLLLMDVTPVFVLEGKAPTLKYDTIAARNAVQFKGAKPKKNQVKGGKDRSRFNFTLKQCEEMLKHMGLACVQGNGEAEAMCAYLNEDNLVDGCISQDSDCFAYGAKIVYKNFSISQQGSHAASGGAVDVYDIQKAIDKLGFGRNKIIALALLCGSDYSEGVFGVGKDSALKLFEKIDEKDVLNRVRSWSKDVAKYDNLKKKIADKNVCSSCGHLGKVQQHTRNGCYKCGTTNGCNAELYKNEFLSIKNELAIRTKALADPKFPNENLISEFLIRKDKVENLELKWRKPDMIKFVRFTVKYLQWEEIYSFEKFLPILTRWQLLHYNNVKNDSYGILYPDFIKKVRNPKGISSYEIIWSDKMNHFTNLIPDEQLANVDRQKLWSTIEPQQLVKVAYPELVNVYEQSKIKTKKPTKRKQKAKTDTNQLENMLANTSISEIPIKKKPTAKVKPSGIISVENYFKKALINNHNLCNLKEPIKSSTPCKSNYSFDVNMSGLDDDDPQDLSDIVDNIVKRKPPNLLKKKLNEINKKLVFGEMQDISTSFYCISNEHNDLFEQSFNKMIEIDDNENKVDENKGIKIDYDENEVIEIDDNNTEEYDHQKDKTHELKYISSFNDCFEICTTSLFDRIKFKQ